MSLPWVRLDSDIASHDKVLNLLSDDDPLRWQAFSSYVCALGWSGGHGTDGRVPRASLPFVHGTPETARLLEKYGLWDVAPGGWQIRNFEERQETAVVREAKTSARKEASRKGNCVRHHGAECGCWRQTA